MSRINKQLNASNSNIYTPVFVESILKVNIPVSIYLKSADHFDDKYISSTSDSWVFDYSGSRCYAHFRQDKISNQLIKYICFHYASAKCPAQVPGVLHAWSLATDHCISKSAFTFTVLKDYLETQEIKPQYFYFIIFGLKILCTEAFPGFTLEDYEDLEFIPRPHSHDWGIYQEIDHVLDPLEKNMISKGLFEMAVAIRYGENYSLNTMRDAVILGLTYVTGARPVQLAKLAVKDLRIDTRNSETGLIRYSLLLPYAKQRHVTTERLFLAIPAEIGALIRHYIERAQLKPDGKLFEFSNSAPFNVSRAINKAFLCFSPPDYQAAVKRGEAALPTITPTDLRHNVGHSLAMQGVSAEEIAHILGHSSLTVAKYYILATPALGEDALITIRGFLNIVALIQRVESDAEKIALNCLLLLVITGFRSIEAFNLRQDALFKRQIDDPALCKRFQDKGLPDYFLGIRYVGVKGAGERTHWVEPLAVPLVESIFSTVKMLTAPIRSHLTYLRAKSFADYLPQAISNMPGEQVELDDVVKYITQTTSSFRGRAGQRDKTSKALSKRGVLPAQEIPGPKNSKAIYYSKTDLNHYIKTEFGLTNANEPCTHAWMENGKRYQVNYEDLLFLHEKGSLALKRTLALLATPIPFTNTLMNKFLGNVEPDGSVFSKYQLLEEDGTSTRMRTHIPRHNINTFLAIAEISDHLQAMLMGRVDITQNQHYQHLALAGRRKAASLMPLQPISTALTATPYSSSVATPLDIVKQTGQLAATEHMAMDNTIKANLHTFDDRDDVARFIEASFADGLFEDVAAAFEEIRTAEGPEQASAMVARHAVLYPLKFGSCMREVNLWGCPYRLKCQSAAFCEHFTLTGRMDELPNLIAKKQALQKAYSKLTQLTQRQPDYQTRLADIEKRLHQLKAIQAQWQRRAKTQQLVATENVLSGEVITEGKVRTLAQLFALEYQQLMKEND